MGDSALNFAFPPAHPGEILKEDVLPVLGMTQEEFANHLGISRNTLSKVLHGRQRVTQDIAARLGKALGNGARFWLALQMQYDVWQAEKVKLAGVKRIRRKKAAA